MKKKVRVKLLPKAVYGMNVTGKINNADGSQTKQNRIVLDDAGVPDISVGRTLQPTDRKNATLEAEKGETVVTQLDQANSGGIPEFYTIGGKPHSQGGTPLNLPPDSFIFSKDKKMKISDPDVLAQFGKSVGKSGKKSYTPAEISKQYNINKYRAILADPNSDFHSINTAKQMITNYNLKLGGLAMVQESIKGFDNGIPGIAMPYLESVGINPMDLLPESPMPQQAPQQMPMGRFGGDRWPMYPMGGGVDEIDNPYSAEMFANITSPDQALELMKGQRLASGQIPTAEQALKMTDNIPVDKAYFDAVKKYTGMEFANTGEGEWSYQGTPAAAPKAPTLSDKPFVPGFKYEGDKLYQKRQGRITGEEHWQASNPNMASMYAKKYGNDTMDTRELQKQIQENPEAFASTWGQQADQEAQLASISLKPSGVKQYGGAIPEYADGGAIRSQNVPSLEELRKKGLAKWDMNAEGYNEVDVKPGDYIKKADGKWYQATMEDITISPYEGDIDPKLGALLGEAYGRLEQRIKSNTDLQDALYKKYKENMNKAKPRNNLSEVDLEAARGLSKEEVVDNFLRAQKQIMSVQSKGPIEDKAGVWDKDLNNYRDTISELGYEPMNAAETAAFQGAYISLQNLMDADPKFREQLADFNIGKDTQTGKGDEPGGGTGRATISDIDGWFGNTTIGQAALYAPAQKQLAMKEAEWIEAKKDPAVKHLQNTYQQGKTPFWTEDIINEAFALKNLWGIQKLPPWNAMPGTKLPNPTFMSPDQQIQNILGASGQGVRGAGAFGSPQGYVANTAALQGNAMQQVANAIGNVADKNVQVANQFELQRANIMNRANERRAQLATNLHDKNAILNQQFANAKNKAWDEVRQGMVNMWTNRGKTQNLNTFSDQYDIDPVTGFKIFTGPRALNPKNAQPFDLGARTNELMSQIPGLTADKAAAIAMREKAGPTSATGFTGVDPTELGAGYPGGAPSGYQ